MATQHTSYSDLGRWFIDNGYGQPGATPDEWMANLKKNDKANTLAADTMTIALLAALTQFVLKTGDAIGDLVWSSIIYPKLHKQIVALQQTWNDEVAKLVTKHGPPPDEVKYYLYDAFHIELGTLAAHRCLCFDGLWCGPCAPSTGESRMKAWKAWMKRKPPKTKPTTNP